MPEHRGQIRHGLPLLAELQQGVLARLRTGELIDPLIDLLTVHLRQTRRGYSLQDRHKSHSLLQTKTREIQATDVY